MPITPYNWSEFPDCELCQLFTKYYKFDEEIARLDALNHCACGNVAKIHHYPHPHIMRKNDFDEPLCSGFTQGLVQLVF